MGFRGSAKKVDPRRDDIFISQSHAALVLRAAYLFYGGYSNSYLFRVNLFACCVIPTRHILVHHILVTTNSMYIYMIIYKQRDDHGVCASCHVTVTRDTLSIRSHFQLDTRLGSHYSASTISNPA